MGTVNGYEIARLTVASLPYPTHFCTQFLFGKQVAAVAVGTVLWFDRGHVCVETATNYQQFVSGKRASIPGCRAVEPRGVRIFDSANSNFRKGKFFDSNSIRANSNCHFAIRFARIYRIIRGSVRIFVSNSLEFAVRSVY
jgi:hypothetical protein